MRPDKSRRSIATLVAILVAFLTLMAVSREAVGQTCSGLSWTTGANVWAAEGDVMVMLNNQSRTMQPSIPTYLDDGNFNPWGYPAHPQSLPQLNPVWSCPSGSPAIAVAGAKRETVSFQVFITAGPGDHSVEWAREGHQLGQ